MAKVTEIAAELAKPFAEQVNCTIWDVQYVKEAGEWFLRVYIDKEDGVSIDDCVEVSRHLSDALDEVDPIEGSYTLEVSSAGLERPLKKPQHFELCMGKEVTVKFYRPINGKKEYVGILSGYENGDVIVDDQHFLKKDIAHVKLHATFEGDI